MVDYGDCGATGGIKVGKYSERNLPQRHFVHHESHMTNPGSNPDPGDGKPATNRLSYTTIILPAVRMYVKPWSLAIWFRKMWETTFLEPQNCSMLGHTGPSKGPDKFNGCWEFCEPSTRVGTLIVATLL
jgi:hypothetical protein